MPGGKRNRGNKTNRAIQNLKAGLEKAESEQQSGGLEANMVSLQLQDNDDQDKDNVDGEDTDTSAIDKDEVGAGNGKPERTVTDTPTEQSGFEAGYTGKGKAAVRPTEAAEPQIESVGDNPLAPAISSDDPADGPAVSSNPPATPAVPPLPATNPPAPESALATPTPATTGPPPSQLAPHQRKWEDLTWEEQTSANKLSLKKKPITAKTPQRFIVKRTAGADSKQGVENAEVATRPNPPKASFDQVARPDSSLGPALSTLAHNTPFVAQSMNNAAEIEEDALAKEARLLNEDKVLKIARLEKEVEKWYEIAMEERNAKEAVQREVVILRKELHAIKNNGKTKMVMDELVSQNRNFEMELKQANGNLIEHRHHTRKINAERDADEIKIENLDKAVTAAQSELRDKLQEVEGLQHNLEEAAFDMGELHRHIDHLETAITHAQELEKENAELNEKIRSVNAGLEETFCGIARGLPISEQLEQIRALEQHHSPLRTSDSSASFTSSINNRDGGISVSKNREGKRVVSIQDEIDGLGEHLSDPDDDDEARVATVSKETQTNAEAPRAPMTPKNLQTDERARTSMVPKNIQTEADSAPPLRPATVEAETQTDPLSASPSPIILYGPRPILPPATFTTISSAVPIWMFFLLALLALSAAVLCLDLIREKAVWAAANDLTYDRLMGIPDETWLDWVVLGVLEVTSEATSELIGSPMARSLFG